ncbi:MAG: SAM-dependent methyltransferase, partial [Firmicutes bacterium]|nr:SAM-dependent methyltransferase [Bacillota bacterium]
GVMTPQGQVHAKHYGKFRQINRFLEIVDDVMDYLPGATSRKAAVAGVSAPLKIIDFGCGKAYLTFALYYYLKKQKNMNVDIVGLDLKEDVIAFCNNVASDLNYEGLHFEMGDIADYDETARADMVVTLHACDVATDFALMKAVTWEASVILSVPCCQHELFYQIENDMNASILKQGILKERISAILTDGLRALKLEEHGYDVSMIEFTSLEHTAKNIMLRCVRDNAKEPSAARKKAMEHAAAEYKKLTEFWNVKPTIGQMK